MPCNFHTKSLWTVAYRQAGPDILGKRRSKSCCWYLQLFWIYFGNGNICCRDLHMDLNITFTWTMDLCFWESASCCWVWDHLNPLVPKDLLKIYSENQTSKFRKRNQCKALQIREIHLGGGVKQPAELHYQVRKGWVGSHRWSCLTHSSARHNTSLPGLGPLKCFIHWLGVSQADTSWGWIPPLSIAPWIEELKSWFRHDHAHTLAEITMRRGRHEGSAIWTAHFTWQLGL